MTLGQWNFRLRLIGRFGRRRRSVRNRGQLAGLISSFMIFRWVNVHLLLFILFPWRRGVRRLTGRIFQGKEFRFLTFLKRRRRGRGGPLISFIPFLTVGRPWCRWGSCRECRRITLTSFPSRRLTLSQKCVPRCRRVTFNG